MMNQAKIGQVILGGFLLVAAAWGSGQVYAQRDDSPAPPHPPGARQRGERRGPGAPAQWLNLTDAQQQQIEAIETEFRTQVQALEAAKRQKVRALLTEEQIQQLDAFEAQKEERPFGPPGFGPGAGFEPGPGFGGGPRSGRGPGGGPAAGILRQSERLGLTEAQVTRIQAILADANQQAEALRTAGEQDSADREAIFQQLHELNRQAHEAILALLTEQQKALLPPMPPAPAPPVHFEDSF